VHGFVKQVIYSPNGGTLLFTGNPYTTPSLAVTTTYYVTICPAPFRIPVTVYVNPCSTIIANFSSTDSTLCVGDCINFSDLSKAEYYNNYSPYTHVTGMDVYFYGVNDGGNGATVDFNIWGDNSGQPNTILGTATATLAQIDNAVGALSYGVVHVTFPSPVNVGGTPFYCGVTMNGFGGTDSLAIVTSTLNTPNIDCTSLKAPKAFIPKKTPEATTKRLLDHHCTNAVINNHFA